MLEGLREKLDDLRAQPMSPVGLPTLLAVAAAAGLVLLVYAFSDEGWVPILDSLNLAFHEAGHPVFGLLGFTTLTALGGTLMQFLVPLVVAGTAWARRQTAGVALALLWFFQNGLPTARYMADARTQELPLVGGGEHDWAFLLAEWGVLERDVALATTLRNTCLLGMAGVLAWLVWRWVKDRGHQR